MELMFLTYETFVSYHITRSRNPEGRKVEHFCGSKWHQKSSVDQW